MTILGHSPHSHLDPDSGARAHCAVVPPWMLQHIADAPSEGPGDDSEDRPGARAAVDRVDPDVAEIARRTLAIDQTLRAARQSLAPGGTPGAVGQVRETAAGTGGFIVHTANNTADLPGQPVRAAGDPASGDVAVDEAWEHVRNSLEMFAEVYEWTSYDGRGATVLATVHYERNYDNAFWEGKHLVFGDGDGKLFDRFTKPIDIGAHEFVHAVTEHTAGLVYRDQPGALNESVSDVFAACLKQRLLGQTADEGDWLIGEGLFLPAVEGRALRSMSEPGSAYNDDVLGRDPQPGHMDDFVVTAEDNGGVHYNSGIPNRAFYLAAVAIGGSAAEGAGRIWFAALRSVSPEAEFAEFAAATIEAAGQHAELVRGAWETVGVVPADLNADQVSDGQDGGLVGAPESPGTADEKTGGARRVVVRRSGGIVGRTVSGEVDLAGSDPIATEVRSLVSRVDLHAVRATPPQPDGFTYSVLVDDQQPVTFGHEGLSGDLRRLVEAVLDEGTRR